MLQVPSLALNKCSGMFFGYDLGNDFSILLVVFLHINFWVNQCLEGRDFEAAADAGEREPGKDTEEF